MFSSLFNQIIELELILQRALRPRAANLEGCVCVCVFVQTSVVRYPLWRKAQLLSQGP